MAWEPPSVVYSAAGWFSDSEPFFSMIYDPRKFTKQKASRSFLSNLNREAGDMWRGGDWGMTKRDFLDSLAWSGIHEMRLNQVLPMMPRDRGVAEEILDDLARHGKAYIPTGM